MSRLVWDEQKAQSLISSVHAEVSAFLGPDAASASALLPIFHALQAHFGFIDRSGLQAIALRLNMSKAEVHGALSFYHDFRTEPAARHRLHICRAEACQSMGCEQLIDHLAHHHGLIADEPAPHGPLQIESVYCLGNCGLAPAALLDERPIGRVDLHKVDALVRRAQGLGHE